MGYWSVDILLFVEKYLCWLLEIVYCVNCRDEFVVNIGDWIECEL